MISIFFDAMMGAEGFDFDFAYGVDGKLMTDAVTHYDIDTHMHSIGTPPVMDSIGTQPGSTIPLLCHWGDLATANSNADKALANARSLVAAGGYLTVATAQNVYVQVLSWPTWLHLLGRNADAAAYMLEANATPEGAEPLYQNLAVIQPGLIQEVTGPDGVFSSKQMTLVSKAVYSLVTGDPAGINGLRNCTPDQFVALGQGRNVNISRLHSQGSPMWPALAFERFGKSEQALAFASKVLETDLATGGDPVPWTRCLAHSCRGRILAALGESRHTASLAFEALAHLAGRGLLTHSVSLPN